MKRLINNEDVFVKRCAEQQSEIDELKEDNKQLNKALDEERSKEAYINTELKKENKRLNKFNNYYKSQLKAIKTFVDEDNKQYVIDTLNDINLTNEKE